MNTRIRYVASSLDTDAFLTSTQNFQSSSGIFYTVHLNLMDMTYEVKEVGNGTTAARGRAVNLALLKSKAKKDITSLGVVFSSEKRIKTAEVALAS